jgi:monovalent cation:H+ antiporter-2, CPA2 family
VQVSVPLLLQLGTVLTAVALLAAVLRRFALSPIPVYLLAGLALGKKSMTAPRSLGMVPAGRAGYYRVLSYAVHSLEWAGAVP